MENIEEKGTKRKRGSKIEQIQARQISLQNELKEIKKRENEYKNKIALKMWAKIKYLFLDQDILPRLSDKDFLNEVTEKITQIVNEYKPNISDSRENE